MSLKEKIIGLILVMILVVIIYKSNQNDKKEGISIDNNKYITVGKIFKIVSRRSFTHVYYYYNYNGLRHETWKNADVSEDEVLNNFYRVNISTENPSYSEILLDQEVTDSTEIVNAGFEYK
jgi:hypothetical protein